MAYAFRCRNCNTLAEAGHAGERDRPAKCATCGAGVTFSPDGIKTYNDDNWLILADADAHEIAQVYKYHGITEDDIERHVPTPAVDPDHVPVEIAVAAVEAVGQKDKTR